MATSARRLRPIPLLSLAAIDRKRDEYPPPEASRAE